MRRSEIEILAVKNKELKDKMSVAQSFIDACQRELIDNLRRMDVITQRNASQSVAGEMASLKETHDKDMQQGEKCSQDDECSASEQKINDDSETIPKEESCDAAASSGDSNEDETQLSVLSAPILPQGASQKIRDCFKPNLSYLWNITDPETNKLVFLKWVNSQNYWHIVSVLIKYIWFNVDHPENHSIRDATEDPEMKLSEYIEFMEHSEWDATCSKKVNIS
ncbi:MAG: hypothetical protein M0R33_22355 [Methylomonas sp.]|jgi:hypothetical protein|uniref:hypothetical protein n=1 Tax=Methylomonas sp. TaxID=418 RepID=UPI0025D94132|nr:hypothetical protein [Methylomonas sp.]MCK9609187.1 hypothetical protein [Methylomonas sp.]